MVSFSAKAFPMSKKRIPMRPSDSEMGKRYSNESERNLFPPITSVALMSLNWEVLVARMLLHVPDPSPWKNGVPTQSPVVGSTPRGAKVEFVVGASPNWQPTSWQ